MSVIAKQDITLFFIKDISSVTRYYTLQSSEPSAPTTNPPSSEWSDSEPSYTSGSNDTLYFVDLTVFTDETWTYSKVSKSSSYEATSMMQTNINSINLSVKSLETTTTTNNAQIKNLEKQVGMCVTEESVDIKIENALYSGTTSLHTETGFTFDADGLKINKEGAQTSTKITEDGMTINDTSDNTLLSADNTGVEAKNLHASTYLIVGTSIRFENYTHNGFTRAGCFWVGG